MNLPESILYLIVLIFSVVIHEVAHGFAARRNGDETAAMSGRLSLNPVSHIDLFGSIILPGILILTGSRILFGWAKPVPVNVNNFRNQKKGILQVSLAGVLANFGLAIIFGVLSRVGLELGFSNQAVGAMHLIVIVNLVLGFFNLMPIPPLDGSKILFVLIPSRFSFIESFMNKYYLVILIAFIFLLSGSVLEPLVYNSFKILTGISF